jgi:hypothetical protein
VDPAINGAGVAKDKRVGNNKPGNYPSYIKKKKCKPWLKKMWCIAKITKEYRERMYKILDLYLSSIYYVYFDKNLQVYGVGEGSWA